MVKKIYLILFWLLVGCDNNNKHVTTTTNNTPMSCSKGAPPFTMEIATHLITKWSQGLHIYSKEVSGNTWSSAAQFVADNYDRSAVLLPTMSPTIRIGSQQIYNYFVYFLTEEPVMHLVSNEIIKLGCGFGIADGYYDFILSPNNQQSAIKINARYTFAYVYHPTPQPTSILIQNGPESGITKHFTQPSGWYIDVQHSSILPHINQYVNHRMMHHITKHHMSTNHTTAD